MEVMSAAKDLLVHARLTGVARRSRLLKHFPGRFVSNEGESDLFVDGDLETVFAEAATLLSQDEDTHIKGSP